MESKLKYYLEIADNSLVLAKQLQRIKASNIPGFELITDTEYLVNLEDLANRIYIQASKIPSKSPLETTIWLKQRSTKEFYNCLLVEIETADCYENLVRQLFFDTYNYLYLLETTRSNDVFLANLSREKIAFFDRRMLTIQNRILQFKDYSPEVQLKIQKAVLDLWKYIPDMFQASSADILMLSQDVGVDLSDLESSWMQNLSTLLRQVNVALPLLDYNHLIGKEGQHTSFLSRLIKR